MATAKANIDYAKRTMDISVGDQKISLNIFQASQHMRDNENYFTIDVIDSLVEESCSLNQIEDFGKLRGCEQNFSVDARESQPINLDANSEPSFSSIESPPPLELKPLSDSLKYVFLGPNKTLPVIIAADLTLEQEVQLIEVLRDHQAAIGWSIADLKGISPSLCMHHIYIEVDAKSVRDMQRRQNPNMKEVVKKR